MFAGREEAVAAFCALTRLLHGRLFLALIRIIYGNALVCQEGVN
jgi:hypothetical protein